MRQAGVLAAAGLNALDHHRGRLGEDHEKARWLAGALAQVPGFSIDLPWVQTNIVIMDVSASRKTPEELLARMQERGVLLSAGNYLGLRAVTHLDVSFDQVRRAADIITEIG